MKSPLRYLKVTETSKSYICVLFVQSMYSGVSMFTKTALTKGMSPFAFVVYQQVFATLALAPLVLFFERDKSTCLSRFLVCKIFFVAFFGITLPLNLYVLGINHTTATLASASANTIPVITLILAVSLRMERICINKWHGVAKVLGTVVCLSGTMVIVFVKGPPVYPALSQSKTLQQFTASGDKMQWVKGCLIILLGMTFVALWIIMQGPMVKVYPAKLRLTTLQCFFSCIQSAVWAIAMDRETSSWKLHWDLCLLSAACCGVGVNGVAYWLRIWGIEKKGPVFVSAFVPLTVVLTTILSVILWKEALHWGSVGGVVLLVGGLYGVLWGKHREAKIKATENKSEENIVESIPECNTVRTTCDSEVAVNSFTETRRPPE